MDESDTIVRQLTVLTRLVALALIANRPQREQVWLLSKAGLAPKEISDLLGTTANTVRVQLHAARKVAKKRKRVREE
jgi:DNA-directed RNA polymerase specialized sigma24 family protein